MIVYLIRHGLTEWNAVHRYQGQTDVPLSPVGREQAERLAERLRAVPLDAIWASDLSRAHETALRVAAGRDLAVRRDPRLRELSLGALEGLTRAEVAVRYPSFLEGWRSQPHLCRAPDSPTAGQPGGGHRGEHLGDVQARAWEALEDIRRAHEGGRDEAPGERATAVAVVSHGYAILTLLCRALDLPLPHFRRLWLDTASLSELRTTPTGWSVRRVNDTAHLDG